VIVPAVVLAYGLVHLEASSSFLIGPDSGSVAFRGYAGLAFDVGSWRGGRAWVGGGVHYGNGLLYVSDPRALDGTVELSYWTVGPELRLGLADVDGGLTDTTLYVAATLLHAGVDPRLVLDPVGDVAGGWGGRAAIGLTAPDAWSKREHDDCCSHHDDDLDLLYALMPNNLELSWEHAAGGDRFGVGLGWGF